MELEHADKSVSNGMEEDSWIGKFKAMLLHQCSSTSSLISLMTYYARNIHPNVNETRPLKADQMRDSIRETLLFFLYCFRYQNEGSRESMHAAYLDIMSDLLAVYIDTELKTSRRSVEKQTDISARLASYLYVCLDHSPQHLLDTLLKVQFMSSTYHQILDPLIERILEIVPKRPADDITYVRYFLVYRIWRRINKDATAKNLIVTKAKESMGPMPITLSKYLVDNVLPKVPNNENNNVSIEVLLTQHIDLERSCVNFLKFNKEASNRTKNASELQKAAEYKTDNSNNASRSNDNQNNSNIRSGDDKVFNRKKILSRKSVPKHNELVVIDLTSDEKPGKILKQKKKTRLSWLQEVAKRRTSIANSRAENNQKLDLTLFVTTNVSQLPAIQDITQETVTSALRIEALSLKEEEQHQPLLHGDIECQLTLLTGEVDTRHNEINSVSEPLGESTAEVINKISLANGNTDDNEIKVQIENVQSELEVTTTEVSNEISIENNIEIYNELVCHDIVNERVEDEIINDTNSTSTNSTSEHQRNTVLHINQRFKIEGEIESMEINNSTDKIHNVDYQEHHIDGLSLLASVSQRVSHLDTTTVNRETIKVKDYKSLTAFVCKDGNNDIPIDSMKISNGMFAYSSDDDIDKVALHLEVSSSDNVSDDCTSTLYYPQPIDKLGDDEMTDSPNTSTDSSIQFEREVIMNGETIVLYQKSPNSNMYIINKAGEEVNNLSEKAIPVGHDDSNYSYEIYDKKYRISQPMATQPFEDSRRAQKVKVTNQSDSTRASIDLQKSNKKQPTTGIEVKSPRRHRMRQEFNGCTPELVDPHSIHIQPTTSLYHSNYPGTELYISRHSNYNPANHPAPPSPPPPPPPVHPNSTRCTYSNCGYDIVTRCNQCIPQQGLPTADSKQGASVDASYYIENSPPLHQQCTKHEPDVKLETKSHCKMEIDSDDNKLKFLEPNVKSKLPPKKRFSLMSTCYKETTVKTENSTINYPNTPMISIASLEANSIKVSNQLDNHRNNEIMRGDYRKEPINGHNYDDDDDDDKKRKRTNSKQRNGNDSECNNDFSWRPSKKVQEQQKSPVKNSNRQTRVSQRKVPRVNYSYPEIDTECIIPSGQQKRKRKKASR